MVVRKFGFTLVELLVVIGVVSVLMAILFPVFASARAQGQKAVCSSNFHQAQLAMALYVSDYDDTFPPINHRPGMIAESSTDRTWVQLLLPYARSFGLFSCPADPDLGNTAEALFDRDLVPGDLDSRFYTASLHSNVGFNYLYLSPVVLDSIGWQAIPRTGSQIVHPSKMLLFVDSVHDVNESGKPVGGGSWLVVPPCRYASTWSNRQVDTFGLMGRPVYARSAGWDVSAKPSGFVFGGAWPWHRGKGTIVTVDGSAKAASPEGLAAGCDVQPEWGGLIQRDGNYQWDLE